MKKILFLLAFGIILSCNQNDFTNDETISSDETPNVLLDNDYGGSDLFTSYSKRWSNDLVVELFEEAQEKNRTLRKWVKKIDELQERSNDNIEILEDYKHVNNRYWDSAGNYNRMISDSIVRKEIQQIFAISKSEYQTKLTPLTNEIAMQQKKSFQLEDKLLVLKLMVSLDMMKKYQKNEVPEIAPLKDIISDYDQLIEEGEILIKDNK